MDFAKARNRRFKQKGETQHDKYRSGFASVFPLPDWLS
jgi:hypothetical protein